MAAPINVAAPAQPKGLFFRIVGFISTVCGITAASMIMIAVVITCQMIWLRFVMNQSTIWQTEAVVYLMVGATMIGLPYVQKLRGHVNVDLLPRMLPPTGRLVLAYIVFAASLAVIGVMVWHGFELWHVAWSRGWTSDTVWGAKLWVPYLALPVGFGLYFLQLFADMIAVAMREATPFDLGEQDPS